jgi:periplasmic divalent cation tolerance protein
MVEEKLAACANILPGITSVYRWKDKIEQSQEVVLILKTRESFFSDVENRIKELHPYDLPCIVALPIEYGHQPFLNWLEKETQK